MRNRIYKKIILAVFVIGFFALADRAAFASEITSKNIIGLVNESRIKEGLKALVENDKLSAAAKDKANDMVKKDYFAHTSPSGVTPWHWLKKNEYNYKYAGENLAINFESTEKQHEAWMKSKSHRDNILNASYREIGVAVFKGKADGNEALITVEFFGAQVVGVADAVKKESDPVAAEKKVSESEKTEQAPALSPESNLNAELANIYENKYASPIPKIKAVGNTNKNKILNIIWLVSFALVGFSIVAGPLVISMKGLKDAVILWKRRHSHSNSFALINSERQKKMVEDFWQNMKKAAP